MLAYAVVLVRTAWLCDDAYITLRTVANWHAGHGLTWNPGERVQTFTHPLWMLVLLAAVGATGDVYLTPLGLCLALSLGTVALLMFGLGRRRWEWAAVAGLALVMSRGFMDYSTSGLENALSHFLLAALAMIYFAQKPPEREFRILAALAFLASLIVLNRMDLVLLIAPALAWAAWRARIGWPKRLAAIMLGAAPLAAWLLFALVYYGTPLPNTYYAKLGAEIPGNLLLYQGMLYFADSLLRDPVTLPFIIISIVALIISEWRRKRGYSGDWRSREEQAAWPLAAGIALYLVYVVKIGGDFMAGRFFAAPLFVAAVMMTRLPWRLRPAMAGGAALTVIVAGMLASPVPTILSGANYGNLLAERNDAISTSNITDERMYYYNMFGLLTTTRENLPERQSGPARADNMSKVVVYPFIGTPGFTFGPASHIVDPMALSSPLLARMPAMQNWPWRPGHMPRLIPRGYIESQLFDENRIEDERVAALYDDIRLMTRGPQWSRERWAAIWRVNTGRARQGNSFEAYRLPTPEALQRMLHDNGFVYVRASDLDRPLPNAARWDDPRHLIFFDADVRVMWPALQRGRAVEISFHAANRYTLALYRGEELLMEAPLEDETKTFNTMAVATIELTEAARQDGFDRVEIRRAPGEVCHSLGHIVLINP